MVMKLIITESQYNELNKVDDVYDGLKPYFRRRIKYINIPETIHKVIENIDQFYHKTATFHYLVTRIISSVVWKTIPDEMGANTSMELFEYHDTMAANIMDKYGDYIKRLLKKKLGK